MIRPPFFKADPVYFGDSRKINPNTLEKLKRAYVDLDKGGEFKKIIMKWEGRDDHKNTLRHVESGTVPKR